MQTGIDLIWGCEPRRQLEVAWVNALLKNTQVNNVDWHQQLQVCELHQKHGRILVESGLLLLEKRVSQERRETLHKQRLERIDALSKGPQFTLIHLSDEEGLDGDILYQILPKSTKIWRNFPYERFDKLHHIKSFPIGPRGEFLEPLDITPASERALPWTFMGTLWKTGNRLLATSIFLHEHPSGAFFGGRSFGTGIPIKEYRSKMRNSVFALCPEGDRHFDTFRLYESLQAGCIPLVVERQGQAVRLLGDEFPAPIFANWKDASLFVSKTIDQHKLLNQLQQRCENWWCTLKNKLSKDLLIDLCSENKAPNQYDFNTACGA